MVPSPKVATYDLQPEMSAPELTEKAVEAIRSGRFDLIVLNFANPDMVGHTGSLTAAIRACEAVDRGVGAMLSALDAVGGAAVIIADHGNCELMRDPETGGPRLGRRYAAAWDGPRENRVYVQNAGRASHGIADPQLALLAWRSAAVLNDALGRRAFALDGAGSVIEWSRNGDSA